MAHEDEKVYQVDMNQSEEEIKKQMDANEAAKLRHAARLEQERFEKPGMIDKFLAGIDKLKQMWKRRESVEQAKHNNNQTTR